MPELVSPIEDVGAIALTLAATGIQIKRGDGTYSSIITWNDATGTVTITPGVTGGASLVLNGAVSVTGTTALHAATLSGLLTANLGALVTGGSLTIGSGWSITSAAASNLSLNAVTGQSVVLAINGSAILTASASGISNSVGLTISAGNFTVSAGSLTVSAGASSLRAVTAGGLITANAGALVTGGNLTMGAGWNITGAAASDLLLNTVPGQAVRLTINGTAQLVANAAGVTITSGLVLGTDPGGTQLIRVGGALVASGTISGKSASGATFTSDNLGGSSHYRFESSGVFVGAVGWDASNAEVYLNRFGSAAHGLSVNAAHLVTAHDGLAVTTIIVGTDPGGSELARIGGALRVSGALITNASLTGRGLNASAPSFDLSVDNTGITITNGSTATLCNVGSTGSAELKDTNQGNWADLVFIGSGVTPKLQDAGNKFSGVATTAGKINVFIVGGVLKVENLSGNTIVLRGSVVKE